MRKLPGKTIWTAVLFALLGLALGVLFLFDPAAHAFYPVCWFHKLTGLNCPACGSLRAVHHLLHGEVITALGYNPLVVLSVPVAAGFFARKLMRTRAVAEKRVQRSDGRAGWWLLIVLVAFGVLRNLPFSLFAWMAR